MGRLRFFWWGRFWRGWLQFGRGFTVVADKDHSVQTVWAFLIGPLEIEWWDRQNWRDWPGLLLHLRRSRRSRYVGGIGHAKHF